MQIPRMPIVSNTVPPVFESKQTALQSDYECNSVDKDFAGFNSELRFVSLVSSLQHLLVRMQIDHCGLDLPMPQLLLNER